MGNPQADSSDNYQQDQADYNVQIQYNVQVSYDENSNDPAHYDPNPQGDPSYQPLQSGDGGGAGLDPRYQQDGAANDHQQQQQHFQPPPPQQQQFQPPQHQQRQQQQQELQPPPPQQQQFQPPQHQQQQQQQQELQPPQQQQQFGRAQNAPPLQFNQPYAVALPPQPVAQFPPPSHQMNLAYANQGAYPPQQQPSYPPTAAAPQQYPPQQQPQYAQQSAPQAYPPNSPPPNPYPPSPAYQQQPAAQPVPFPPPEGGVPQYTAMPPSPIQSGVQGDNGGGQGIPMQPNKGGSVNTEGWRTGLFDCMDDPMNAATTFFFPFLTFGQVAEITDNGMTSCAMGALMYGLIGAFFGMPCIYSCTYRSKLRNKFGLVESPAPDWIVHFLCEPCALCQEYRELSRRGWDPSIGWLGNDKKQQQMQQQPQVAMMPPMNQTMMA